jgi:uncharacterized SAM-binding protein YcdF (DUF218 family)
VGALLLVALIRWQTTLSLLGRYLIYSQAPQSADIILVLAGDFYGPRVLKAAELAKQGYAPLVLISGGRYQDGMEGDYAIAFLATRGYSTRLFESFGHTARSTIEEAIALRNELRRRRVKRVLLVTSDFHSRRSSIVFRLFCPGIDFISVPGAGAQLSCGSMVDGSPLSGALLLRMDQDLRHGTDGLPKGPHRTAVGS